MPVTRLIEGQKLWWVPRDKHRAPYEVVVVKVGRLWAHLDNHLRIDVVSLIADGEGYSPPGRCYLSQSHYETATTLDAAWRDLSQAVRNAVPDGVTVADIEAAKRLLGLSPALHAECSPKVSPRIAAIKKAIKQKL